MASPLSLTVSLADPTTSKGCNGYVSEPTRWWPYAIYVVQFVAGNLVRKTKMITIIIRLGGAANFGQRNINKPPKVAHNSGLEEEPVTRALEFLEGRLLVMVRINKCIYVYIYKYIYVQLSNTFLRLTKFEPTLESISPSLGLSDVRLDWS